MRNCSRCQATNLDGDPFCGKCGAPMAEDVGRTTTQPQPQVSSPSRMVSLASSSVVDEGRFPPGTLLAQRYRIINLIGKGGMGEVYRANDLILGQPVALKFLPREMASDEGTLTRFRNEVRVARQVSHPNVCRVYDLGEVDGQPYLSMEYVDGEDLSALLKRIGHLPQDKALELARQMCAGLAAAHDKGVLHRDLKPANILINSRGQLSITDFGLAGMAEQLQSDVRSGTPAYMAPEQLAGLEVTTKSDIYALGLVLYEMFTGKRAHDGQTRAELQRMKESGSTPSLSSHVKDLDPIIERVIERCLAPDPAKRPATPLAVSAALPGGDPLAAALAAGETPTPEMVAAAGGSKPMRPAYAIGLVALIIVCWIGYALSDAKISMLKYVSFELSAEVLAHKAKEMLGVLGYPAKAADSVYAFELDRQLVEKINEQYKGHAWHHLHNGRPASIYFWYRSSPQPMWPTQERRSTVSEADPPVNVPGMIRISLDPEGRLRSLIALPTVNFIKMPEAAPYNWELLFELAGLDFSRFQPVEPERLPLVSFDQKLAWKGTIDGIPHAFRVEAASFKGKLVYFNNSVDWGPQAATTASNATSQDLIAALSLALQLTALGFSVWLAWRNYRAGRGDIPRAFYLSLVVFASYISTFFFSVRFVSITLFHSGLLNWLANAVFAAVLFGLMYLALEPSVRRRWPEMLIGWTRLFSGGWRDPLVGQHVLLGLAGALIITVLGSAADHVEKNFGITFATGDLRALNGLHLQLAAVSARFANTLTSATYTLFLLFGTRLLLRRQWLAMLVTAAFWSMLNAQYSSIPWFTFGLGIVINGILMFYMVRFGFLAGVLMMGIGNMLGQFPADLDWSTWYAGSRGLCIVLLVGLTIYGYFTATAGYKSAIAKDDLD